MKTRKTRFLIPQLRDGQVWQMVDSSLRIELVGKRLVHYKHYNLKVKRPGVLLSSKSALGSFLQKHRAVLLPERPLPSAAGWKPTQPRRKPKGQTAAKAN